MKCRPPVSEEKGWTPTPSGESDIWARRRIIRKEPGTHSVVRAVMLGALIPGLGQIFNGQTIKEILLILVHVAALCAACWNFILFLLVPFGTWACGMGDAERIARKINRGEPISPWE